MLYPWEVARLRSAITAGQVDTRFEQFSIGKARIALETYSGQEIAPGEIVAFRRPSKIFGRPEMPDCLRGVTDQGIRLPPTKLYSLKECRVIGTTSILSKHSGLFNPTAIGSPAELSEAVERNKDNADGFILQPDNAGPFAYYYKGEETKRIAGTGLFFANPEIDNYGSFIHRVLPQLFAAKRCGIDPDYYVCSDRTPWLREALSLIGLPLRPCYRVREICGDQCERLVFFNLFYPEGFMSPSLADTVSAFAASISSGTAVKPSKSIYVSRALSRIAVPQYRPLAREVSIEQLMLKLGFDIVYPETLSFREQIATFRASEIIIGPSGSGMLNCIFAPPQSRVVDIESFTVAIRQHAKVYSSSGKDYAFCFGQFDPTDDREDRPLRRWAVSEALLQEAVLWATDRR